MFPIWPAFLSTDENRTKNIPVLAVMAMIFALIGYGFLPDDEVPWVIALNQLLALFAI